MTALVNRSTINFMADLLSTNDYVTISSKVNNTEDAMNLLDFIIYVSHRVAQQ